MDYKEYILRNFSYDPDTGIIKRLDRKNSNGSKDHYGYLIIKIKGKQFKAHRIAWLLYYKEYPSKNIDHINRIKDDNRIVNLRDVSQKENNLNVERSPNKDTGEIRITLDKTKGLKKRYVVYGNGKLNRFNTIEEAKKFRDETLI